MSLNKSWRIKRMTVFEIIFCLIMLGILLAIILPAFSPPSINQPGTHVKAQVMNISMAAVQYHSDYGEYPGGFHELNGNNVRGKIYFSGETKTHEGEEIHIKYDLDNDGKVIVDGEEIHTKVAVWTKYKNTIINSWGK